MKVRKNVTIEQRILKQAQEEYDNFSARVERLLAQDLGLEKDENLGEASPPDIVEKAGLTPNQAELLRMLMQMDIGMERPDKIEDEFKGLKTGVPKQKVRNRAKRYEIYTRIDHFKMALCRLSDSDVVPYRIDGDYVVAEQMICHCGQDLHPSMLVKDIGGSGACPNCEFQWIDMAESVVSVHD